jgi:ribonucleoside-diphosphate reductase alpha chain
MQTDTTRENPQGTLPQAADSNSDLSATAPGQLRVIKRNGTVVPYTDDKITVAITKAFLAVEGGVACHRAAPSTSKKSRTRSNWP